ncbi:hypothetical protein AAF712_014863 [Marasmius tenuissimus]|uniref:Uncharacterized protein n=1 Tax=Marasmius tenuissimus TaxID=585030 RepID=A0ABR2ZB40_9AGAR
MRRNENILSPPVGVSEPEWARLLFGGTCCQVCGVRGVNRIDFILRKRICYKCVRNSGLLKDRFHFDYLNESLLVLELVLPSRGRSGRRPPMYYNKDEIDTVLSELRQHRGTDQEEDYVQQRKLYLGQFSEDARRLDEWMVGDFARQKKEARKQAQVARDSRYEEIKARLVSLGYEERNLYSIRWLPGVRSTTQLTEHAWKTLEPRLLREIHRRYPPVDDSSTSSSSETTCFPLDSEMEQPSVSGPTIHHPPTSAWGLHNTTPQIDNISIDGLYDRLMTQLHGHNDPPLVESKNYMYEGGDFSRWFHDVYSASTRISEPVCDTSERDFGQWYYDNDNDSNAMASGSGTF